MDQMIADKCRYDLTLMTAIGAFFQWTVVLNVQESVLHTYKTMGFIKAHDGIN